jgi:hypothetical protein
MKNVLELNIGLLRNTDKLPNEVTSIKGMLDKDFGKHNFRLVNAIGDWGSEETYVAKIVLPSANITLINIILEFICTDLFQDAIAYMINGVGYMAFNPNYKGERYEFNIKYFVKY